MLEITNLRKAHGGQPVLAGVDLTVSAGQILGLLGANGAGKTTLISIAAGLRPADASRVRVRSGLRGGRQHAVPRLRCQDWHHLNRCREWRPG